MRKTISFAACLATAVEGKVITIQYDNNKLDNFKPPAASGCTDKFSYCKALAACGSNCPPFIRDSCCKTCNRKACKKASKPVAGACKDKFSNCQEIVVDKKNCCDTRTRMGSRADGMCCASCTKYQKTPKCQKELKAAVCIDEFGFCAALSANGCAGFTLGNGDKMSKGCCQSCKGKGGAAVAPAASRCTDKFSNCKALAASGSNCPPLIRDSCCKTCKKAAAKRAKKLQNPLLVPVRTN